MTIPLCPACQNGHAVRIIPAPPQYADVLTIDPAPCVVNAEWWAAVREAPDGGRAGHAFPSKSTAFDAALGDDGWLRPGWSVMPIVITNTADS